MTNPEFESRSAALRDVSFPETDNPLRADVNQLGALVGAVLEEQEGPEFFALIESIRTAAIRRRELAHDLTDLKAQLAQINPESIEAVVRAFGTYFNATNLAERVHRIRRRREYQREGSKPQPGGLHDVLARLKDKGVAFEVVVSELQRLCVELVFTAHPTEAVRRALLEKESDVVRGLIEDLDRTLTPYERKSAAARMRTAITSSWQTAENPQDRPTVADEMEHVGFYLSQVIYRVLPVFHEVLEDAVLAVYGRRLESTPSVLRFASWVGGDMDGNPFVGPDTIQATLSTQRRMILSAYLGDLDKLSRLLTQDADRAQFDPVFLARLSDYQMQLQEAQAVCAKHVGMPYRQFIACISLRLEYTLKDHPQGYLQPQEFLNDLECLAHSLEENRGRFAGGFPLLRIIRRARCFGFHFASLDVRQDASVHSDALAQCLSLPQYSSLSESERASRLTALLLAESCPVLPALDAGASKTLDVFRVLASSRKLYGDKALGPYIVSMSQSAADALAVLVLAKLAGTADDADAIDVAPLFETVKDLHGAPEVLTALLSDACYRAHVARRGDRQMVMLGYSDSSKDAGMLASRFALQQAQIAMLEVGRKFGVCLTFFHGRGGSISRGGGKTERAVFASPRGSINGYLRVTEQGEVIHRKYGIRALALRNLEQTCGAVLAVSALPRALDARETLWRERMRAMAAASEQAYRALIHGDDNFPAYFRTATPVDLIERLRLGSRPAKRSGGIGGVSSLRAIPWVFSWSQTRCNLTAWYGVGAGLSYGLEQWGVGALREMANHWPFFQTLLDDMEMVLAKADLDVFEGYSKLSEHHESFYPKIVEEFERACGAVLLIRDASHLLSQDARLARSIRLRNPYVDPINLLQQKLLINWRDAGRQDDDNYRALVATVSGISAGVQNTG